METSGHPCWLVFTEEPSLQSFLGGAGFRPSTVFGLVSAAMCKSIFGSGNSPERSVGFKV